MNDFLYVLGIALIFSSILFLSYMTTRYLASKVERITKGKYLGIIETVALGKDKYLHLIKVGDGFMLLSSSGKGIELICQVEIDNYVENSFNERNQFIFNNVLKDNISRIKNILKGYERHKKE
jgi:flagellar protein FliO/FliZ